MKGAFGVELAGDSVEVKVNALSGQSHCGGQPATHEKRTNTRERKQELIRAVFMYTSNGLPSYPFEANGAHPHLSLGNKP